MKRRSKKIVMTFMSGNRRRLCSTIPLGGAGRLEIRRRRTGPVRIYPNGVIPWTVRIEVEVEVNNKYTYSV